MARTKIAIACQGGGSQTAFTAGVLKALCEANLQDQFEFVGISGTSGGALCATLVWYALRRGEQPIWRRLIEFWRDNTAQSGPERMINNTIIDWLRMVNRSRCLTGELNDSAVLIRSVERSLPPRRCRALRGRRWQVFLENRNLQRVGHLAILVVTVQRPEELAARPHLDRGASTLWDHDTDPVTADGRPQVGLDPRDIGWLHRYLPA